MSIGGAGVDAGFGVDVRLRSIVAGSEEVREQMEELQICKCRPHSRPQLFEIPYSTKIDWKGFFLGLEPMTYASPPCPCTREMP